MAKLRVAQFAPTIATALAQPGIEFIERAPLALLGIQPDAPAAVLDVLLDHAFLPTTGNIAEVGIKQVVRTHGREAGIDHTLLALLDFIDSRLHVVVDAPPRDASQRRKRAGVGIKQHFMALAGVGHQPEAPAGAQFHVRELDLVVVDASHQQTLGAPVKLERFTQRKAQRHEGAGCFASVASPLSHKVGDAAVTAAVALLFDFDKQCPGCATVLLGAQCISLSAISSAA